MASQAYQSLLLFLHWQCADGQPFSSPVEFWAEQFGGIPILTIVSIHAKTHAMILNIVHIFCNPNFYVIIYYYSQKYFRARAVHQLPSGAVLMLIPVRVAHLVAVKETYRLCPLLILISRLLILISILLFPCPPLPRTVLAKLTRRSAPRQVVSGMMSRVLALTPLRLKLCSQAVPSMKPRHWINPIPGSSPPPRPGVS